jgi:phosphatidylserine/phosphatidylglycerophosphate/cardiolipin synthase-like enzyme
MIGAVGRLSSGELQLLAAELRSGRLPLPTTSLALARWFDGALAGEIAADLAGLTGFSAQQLATLIESIVEDRAQRAAALDAVELVATSPVDGDGISLDTSAVVQSMFAAAQQSVDVVGYAIYQGRDVFRVLADRMELITDLRVRMFLNVARGQGDTSAPSEIVRRFLDRFRSREWPEGKRLPEMYYDPRGVMLEPEKRASLHAKCVIVDGRSLFISSANFTEAAHERNIEVGAKLAIPELASRLREFLDRLIKDHTLWRCEGQDRRF